MCAPSPGLKRADVVWRRVDADWCDPLELNAASRLGVPGLLRGDPRRASRSIANMPGAGLVESRALMSFLPALAHRLLGERSAARQYRDMVVRTGQAERDVVLARFRRARDRRRLRRHGSRASTAAARRIGSELDAAQRARLIRRHRDARRRLCRTGGGAALDDAGLARRRLTPRPFALRVFAAATPDGWRSCPAASAACRTSSTRARFQWARARNRPMCGCSARPTRIRTLLPRATTYADRARARQSAEPRRR